MIDHGRLDACELARALWSLAVTLYGPGDGKAADLTAVIPAVRRAVDLSWGTRHHVLLSIGDAGPTGARADTGWVAIRVPRRSDVPGDTACLALDGSRSLEISLGRNADGHPTVRVECKLDGKPHGYEEACPAYVYLDRNGQTLGYAFEGIDVSDLVTDPVRTLRDGREDLAARNIFVDARHATVIAILEAAVERGEAVAIQGGRCPSMHAVMEPGSHAFSIRDASQMADLMARWTTAGTAVTTVRHGFGPTGLDCMAERRIFGFLDGPDEGTPGSITSEIDPEEGEADVWIDYYVPGRGCTGVSFTTRPVEDPDVAYGRRPAWRT